MTIIHLPHPTSTETRQLLLIREQPGLPQFQSQERRRLVKVTEQIWQTLTCSEKLLNTLADDEEIQYNSVPPKRVFTMKVRYRLTGRMQPQPYLLEDE